MRKITIHFAGSQYPPRYASPGAAGADLHANNKEDIILAPQERAVVPTGLYLEIPKGYEGQIRPRSGMALKYGVTLLNAPGTIDSDYRGEVKVVLINHGKTPYAIRKGDRIAQILFCPVIQAEFMPTQELAESMRATGGFGSTGR